jgi:16S rRNA (adenine1518-N6/adenine1519-N6)-dimethyltransferase
MFFKTKKSLGQHFLKNPAVAARMVEAADVTAADTVLEIGPGTGALTGALLATGARVIAIEADRRAVEVLEKIFDEAVRNGRLTLIHDDIRTVALASLPLREGEYKVVANIPYYLSGYLFRLFLNGRSEIKENPPHPQPSTLVFLVQKEVAERIVRDPKESLLSLSLKAYGTPTYVRTVGRGSFAPAPKVDSAILKVSGITRERFRTLDESFFFELLHAGFAARRKQLAGNLKKLLPQDIIRRSFDALGIPHDIRGEDLDIDQWTALATELSTRHS